MKSAKLVIFLISFWAVLSLLAVPISYSDSPAPNGGVAPRKWETDLTAYSKTCNNGSKDCHFSSPVLADLNGDNLLDILVGTNKGYVIAIRHNGSILWVRDVAPAFGMAAGTHEIASSPAVGDIDNDGLPEIAVGVGTTANHCNPIHHGGMIVLEHDGTVKSGWPHQSEDHEGDGCRDSIYSTPALVNLDNDAQLEIVAGGFDKRIYAWNANGTLVPGFPPSSYHHYRLPDWQDLIGRLADTIWSSPAVTDVNGDGNPDIFIGADEGNYDSRYPGNAQGWNCPYTLPPGWPGGYCGGSLYGLNRNASYVMGFPKYILETVQSTPAIADVNGDGYPEIFVGTGTFYYNNSPAHPTHGYVLNGWNHEGQSLPGWPKQLSGVAPASPAIGDIAGDSAPEIIVPTFDSKLYAFFANGQPVPGFPMTPRREQGQTGVTFDQSVVLGDYDGDGKMEIFLNNSWTVTVINGNGEQLTGDNFPNNTKPIYYTYGSLLNSPAVGDIDGDGKLELIAQNSKVYAFDLNSSSDAADWPMFKRDAHRLSAIPAPPRLHLAVDNITLLHGIDEPGNAKKTLVIPNSSAEPFSWSVTTIGSGVWAQPTSGTVMPGTAAEVEITVLVHNYAEGVYMVGEVQINASVNGQPIAGSPAELPVTLHLGVIRDVYMPGVFQP
ncbi:MAG: pyrrolo-quinoline quinone [Candidatus Promineifilaceae bacterium]